MGTVLRDIIIRGRAITTQLIYMQGDTDTGMLRGIRKRLLS
jgi:hypothetical protein